MNIMGNLLNNELRSTGPFAIKRYRLKSTLKNRIHAFTMSICVKMTAAHTVEIWTSLADSTFHDVTLTVYQFSSRKPRNMTDVITS